MSTAVRSLRYKIIAGVMFVVFALAGAVYGIWYSAYARMNTPEMLLARAQDAFERKDYSAAREMAERSLEGDADPSAALILAGKAALAEEDFEDSLAYFSRVEPNISSDSVEARVAAGELATTLGKASEAEVHFRAALSGDKMHPLANSMLGYLLSAEGRSFEAAPFHYVPLKTAGEAPIETLALLAGAEPMVVNRDQMDRFLEKSPKDAAPLIAKARLAMSENRLPEAGELLERIVREAPNLAEGQARYGEWLLGQSPEKLREWSASLPKSAEEHPVVWLVRGRAAEQASQTEAAAHAYWRAVQLDPTHAGATERLGQALQALGRPEAEPIAARAAALRELAEVADNLRRSPPQAGDAVGMAAMERAATLCADLGRLWEACAWARKSLEIDPSGAAWAKALMEREMRRLQPNVPRTLPEANPGRTLNLSAYPLPDLSQPPATSDSPS